MSLAAAAVLISDEPVPAQATGRVVQPDREDAEQLFLQAQRVEASDDRSMQLTAAWLYREAARLWPDRHEKRYRSLWRAAHLYLHHGRTTEAAALFAEAGDQARDTDRPERAATCYLRLARLAAELGQKERTRWALKQARPFLDSDNLTEAERDRLQKMRDSTEVMITEPGISSL